ncbi:MAG: hypothetical protein IJ407_00810 [Clostridia bacterium]|nr:hypothetical protein [Clostridia bacterium]
MNEDKNLLDEIWDAVGLDRPVEKKIPETPVAEPNVQEQAPVEVPVEAPKEAPAEMPKEAPAETSEEKAKETPIPKELVVEKKKDIRFLVIYTIAFVVVISFLIAGSYMITSRIHQEMAENNASLDSSQSTLKNIQDENRLLKEQNAALQKKNEELTASQADNDALMESIGDMVEHGEYLTAAQNAYIRGERTLARTILATIDRDKLSEPAKEYYDSLNDRLN